MCAYLTWLAARKFGKLNRIEQGLYTSTPKKQKIHNKKSLHIFFFQNFHTLEKLRNTLQKVIKLAN